MKYQLILLVTIISLAVTSCVNSGTVGNTEGTIGVRESETSEQIDETIMNNARLVDNVGGYSLEEYKELLDNLSIHSAGEMYSVINTEVVQENNKRKYFLPITLNTYDFDISMISNLKFSVNINGTIYKETDVTNIGPVKLLCFELDTTEIKEIKIIVGLRNNEYPVTHEYIIKDLDENLMNFAPQGEIKNNTVTKLSNEDYLYTEYTIDECEMTLENSMFKQYQIQILFNGWGAGFRNYINNENISYRLESLDDNTLEFIDIKDFNIDEHEKENIYFSDRYTGDSYITINLYYYIENNSLDNLEYADNILKQVIENNILELNINGVKYKVKIDSEY